MMIKIADNKIHLCKSCRYEYPACPTKFRDVMFGDGVGNDNICCCAKYTPLKVKEEYQEKAGE